MSVAALIPRHLMEVGKFVEPSGVINFGKLYSDRTTGFGYTPCSHGHCHNRQAKASITLHYTAVHAAIQNLTSY
jgi:hypothetical protein